MHKRWYRAEAEWDPVSEWPGSERLWEREAAMMAYVTFRMTLPGHTGPLPHQFYCCSRGHHITQSHTQAQPQPLAMWLYLAEHTRSLWLAAESRQHSHCSLAGKTLLGNRVTVLPRQATAAARLSTALSRAQVHCPYDSIYGCFNGAWWCAVKVTTWSV